MIMKKTGDNSDSHMVLQPCPCMNDLISLKEQLINMNTEITMMKSFIMEQLFFIKKSITSSQYAIHELNLPNTVELLNQIKYLREKNKKQKPPHSNLI